MKEWQTFLRRFSDMKEGKRELFIKDLTPGKAKYATKHVVGMVAKSKAGLEDPDTLWLRGESGERSHEPWYISIEQTLEEEWVPGKPYEDVLEAVSKSEKERGLR
ncbi:MAG: hypothetical protein A4E65_00902 [Syntrophorhabdus sp. PtaU1.Bin153]|nr:MAG: hypothetical protein A4E65_00902 [Syntrophorhabdus sp. PtaU1.Bin153]